MLRVSIIGCGKISDQHAEQIQRIPGCEIVSVCDREELLAKQMQDRFKIKRCYCDVQELLENSKPHVVHITTPPQSHFELGKYFLNAGCHIYMEKPFAMNAMETEELISLAEDKNLKITVGHNAQFSHVARKMRTLVKDGFLGGPPLHMDCYYCYNLGDPKYAKALLGDKDHWVRKLPGKLLHNIISHGISKIVEYIDDDTPRVTPVGFASKMLEDIGEDDIIDELRVIIKCSNDQTAYFTFSASIKPVLHQFRLHGSKNALIIDDDSQTLVKLYGDRRKSYLEQFITPLITSKQYLQNAVGNIGKFISNDFHVNAGMKFLIESFYEAIQNNAPLPITYREIVLTAMIMDKIFTSINSKPDSCSIL